MSMRDPNGLNMSISGEPNPVYDTEQNCDACRPGFAGSQAPCALAAKRLIVKSATSCHTRGRPPRSKSDAAGHL